MKNNKTEYALLGLLAMGPKSGYDIKADADAMLSHFWHESYGQIYPMLRRLDEKGLVVKTEEVQEGKPNRYVYTLTEAGREALRAWLSQPVEPIRPRNELLLKLFFGRHTDPATLIDVVAEYRQQLSGLLGRLDQIAAALEREAGDDPDYTYWMLTLESGRYVLRAQLAWCEAATARLAEHQPTGV